MYAPLCFLNWSLPAEHDEAQPLLRSERAQQEQAYYERFGDESILGVWKTVATVIAAPIAAVSAMWALLVFAIH